MNIFNLHYQLPNLYHVYRALISTASCLSVFHYYLCTSILKCKKCQRNTTLKEHLYNVTQNFQMKGYDIIYIFLSHNFNRKYMIKKEKALYYHRFDISWRLNYSRNLDRSTPSDGVRANSQIFTKKKRKKKLLRYMMANMVVVHAGIA